MERSENCSLEQLYISGPGSLTRAFVAGMPNQESITEWNVLEAYPPAAPGAIPDDFTAEPWRLTAAIGSCLGVLLPP